MNWGRVGDRWATNWRRGTSHQEPREGHSRWPQTSPRCSPFPLRRLGEAGHETSPGSALPGTPAAKYHDGVWGQTDWPLHDLSPVMQRVYDRAMATAPTDARILITGEPRSGEPSNIDLSGVDRMTHWPTWGLKTLVTT